MVAHIGKSGYSEHLIPDKQNNRSRKWLNTLNRTVSNTISALTFCTDHLIWYSVF